MNNFWKRTLFGALFVAIMLGGILFCKYGFLLLFFLLNMFALLEFYNRSSNESPGWVHGMGLITGSFIFILTAFWRLSWISPVSFLFLLIPLFIILIAALFESDEHAFKYIGQSVSGILWITIPFSLLVWIAMKKGNFSWQIVMIPLALTWINDTFAYLSGLLMGKHPLAPKLTPKKTIEGFIGGVFFTALSAWILALIIDRNHQLTWLIMGLVVALAAVLGDLVQSKWKRGLGPKDSGSIIPGHGGLLDRFDAFLMVIPFYVLFLKIFAA